MLRDKYKELVEEELPHLHIGKRRVIAIPELLKEVAIELFLEKSNNRLLIDTTRKALNLLRLTGVHDFK